jgi:3-oxoacyl-[acyl-carrier-protein] synthase II
MGEELAGVDAVRIALQRIRANQSDIALVGGAQNGERKDLLMLYDFGGFGLKGDFRPVWERTPAPGFALASMGAFLVLESREHAQKRNATPLAKLSQVVAASAARRPGTVETSLDKLWSTLGSSDSAAVVSGATGTEPATSEERSFLTRHPQLAVRATGSHFGHGVEPQFIMNIAVATLAVHYGKLFAPFDSTGAEQPMTGPIAQAVVTSVGHWRGEGLALVERI